MGRRNSLDVIFVARRMRAPGRAIVDAVCSARGGSVAGLAAADDALARLARNISDAGDRRAVDANRCVRCQRDITTTTTLEVVVSIDTFPCARCATEHATRHMSLTASVARTRADPAFVALVWFGRRADLVLDA